MLRFVFYRDHSGHWVENGLLVGKKLQREVASQEATRAVQRGDTLELGQEGRPWRWREVSRF